MAKSSILYVNMFITQRPVDGLMVVFAWWEQMSFTFQRQKFFELSLFGWNEVNLQFPMVLRTEISNLVTEMQST